MDLEKALDEDRVVVPAAMEGDRALGEDPVVVREAWVLLPVSVKVCRCTAAVPAQACTIRI